MGRRAPRSGAWARSSTVAIVVVLGVSVIPATADAATSPLGSLRAWGAETGRVLALEPQARVAERRLRALRHVVPIAGARLRRASPRRRGAELARTRLALDRSLGPLERALPGAARDLFFLGYQAQLERFARLARLPAAPTGLALAAPGAPGAPPIAALGIADSDLDGIPDATESDDDGDGRRDGLDRSDRGWGIPDDLQARVAPGVAHARAGLGAGALAALAPAGTRRGLCVFVTEAIPQPSSAVAARAWRARATRRGCSAPVAARAAAARKPRRNRTLADLGVRFTGATASGRTLTITVYTAHTAKLFFDVSRNGRSMGRSAGVVVRKGLRTLKVTLSRTLEPGTYNLRIRGQVGKRSAVTATRLTVTRRDAAASQAPAPAVPVTAPAAAAPSPPPPASPAAPACDRDSDGDGVSDCVETQGFDFTYFQPTQQCTTVQNVVTCRQAVQRHVTSNPFDPNTDDDAVLVHGQNLVYRLTDGQEWTLSFSGGLSDPSRADSDADGIGDVEEVFRWGSRPNAVDTDGDSVDPDAPLAPDSRLFDLGERNRTAITGADTDGDGQTDLDEIVGGATSPVVADLPNIDVAQDKTSPGVLIQIGQEVEHSVTLETDTSNESSTKTQDERVNEVTHTDMNKIDVGASASCSFGLPGGGGGNEAPAGADPAGDAGAVADGPGDDAESEAAAPQGGYPDDEDEEPLIDRRYEPPPIEIPKPQTGPIPSAGIFQDDGALLVREDDLAPQGRAASPRAADAPGCAPKASFNYSKEWGTVRRQEHTTGFDREDLNRTERRYETELKTTTDATGSLSATFVLHNESETQSVVVSNLGVTARFICLPSADTDNGPGGCLDPGQMTAIPQPLVPDPHDFPNGINLAPNGSRSITLRADGINTGLLKDFLANPTNISFTTENADLSIPGQSAPFQQTLANVIASTAGLTIDSGDDVDYYRVAAWVKRWWGHPNASDAVPITFREAVRAIDLAPGQRKVTYDTAIDPAGVRRLKTLNGKTSSAPDADGKLAGGWAILANISPTKSLDGDLQNLRMAAGDEVAFAWIKDVDGDGLWDREEEQLATDDTRADTDGDNAIGDCPTGIACPLGAPNVGDKLASDFFEARVGWTVSFPGNWRDSYQVYSSPSTCDGDGDGLPDGPGPGVGALACPNANPLGRPNNDERELGTDPNVADTNGVNGDDLHDPAPLAPPTAPLAGPLAIPVNATFGADSGSVSTPQPVSLCGTAETDPACGASPGYYRITWLMSSTAGTDQTVLGQWRITDQEIGADRTETLLAAALDRSEQSFGVPRKYELYVQAARRLHAVTLSFDHYEAEDAAAETRSVTIEPVTRAEFLRGAAPDGQEPDPWWAATAVPGQALGEAALNLPAAGPQSAVLDDANTPAPPPSDSGSGGDQEPPPTQTADYAARTLGPGLVLPPGSFDARFGFSVQDKGAGEALATAAVVAGSARPAVLANESGAFDSSIGGYPLVQGRVFADDIYGVETTTHSHLLFKQTATTSVQFPVSVAVGATPGLWLDHVVVERTDDPTYRTGTVSQEDGTLALPSTGRWTALGFAPQVGAFMATTRPSFVAPSAIVFFCDLEPGRCGIARPVGSQYVQMGADPSTEMSVGITQLLPVGGPGPAPGASGLQTQWAAVVEPAVAGGCQGADYVVPAGVWGVNGDAYSESLELLKHAGPSTILPTPGGAVPPRAVQGFATFGCFKRKDNDSGTPEIDGGQPGQRLTLRQVMVMRSPGAPSSATNALR